MHYRFEWIAQHMHTHTGHFINTSVQYNMTTLSWVQLLPVYIVRQVINVINLAGEVYLSGLALLLILSIAIIYLTFCNQLM